MGAIYEEFDAELAAWRQQYQGRPRDELVRLALVAVEREQMVSISYREAVIRDRIARLEAPAAVQDLVRHALLWVWKDEEMHMVYLRGMLLRHGNPLLCAQVYAHQVQGAVGGWAGAVRQHGRWSQAPLSQALALGLTTAGILAGKVPRGVRDHLRYASFRAFCDFNVDAERTAAACFRRMRELAVEHPALTPDGGDAFAAIAQDEVRHEKVFARLRDAFDDDDALRAGETAAALEESLREVGEEFLPLPLRNNVTDPSPAGRGGVVHVHQRAPGQVDARANLRAFLERSELADVVGERARALGKPPAALRVVVKVPFAMGYSHRDPSPHLDPELVEELALYLRELGVTDVAVAESPNHYDWFFAGRSVPELARYLGFTSPHYRVVDLSEDQVEHRYRRGMAVTTISATWRDADLRLCFSKLRSHPCEQVYLGVATLAGTGARIDEFLFAERQAQREVAVVIPLAAFPVHFALLDGWGPVPDGLMGVMGCPRPRHPGRFYAGRDILAVDAVAARHLGTDPRSSAILRTSFQWIGDPRGATRVIGPDTPIEDWGGPHSRQAWSLLSLFAYPVYEFASARGSLFVPEMDPEAFPPLEPPGWWTRTLRALLQRMLGLALPP